LQHHACPLSFSQEEKKMKIALAKEKREAGLREMASQAKSDD